MSEIDEYASPEVYMDELEIDCDYGISEFCEEPETKAMGLCTTECALYLSAVEKSEKRENVEEREKVETETEKCPLFDKCHKFMDVMREKCHDKEVALSECTLARK